MIKMLLRLVRYLKTTRTMQLIFKKGYPADLPPLVMMVDASYASHQIDRSSHECVLHGILEGMLDLCALQEAEGRCSLVD